MSKAALTRALLASAEAGLYESVECAIKNGADVNAGDRFGVTALHEAAIHGHDKVVELLIAKGANPLAKTLQGKLALDWARENGNENIIQMLEKFNEDAP